MHERHGFSETARLSHGRIAWPHEQDFGTIQGWGEERTPT